MTTFARITLDPADPKVRNATGSRQRLHAIIAAACDGGGRYLWRLDGDRIYLKTDRLDVPRLEARLGHPVIECTDYARLLDRLERGARYGFCLEANPVRNMNRRRVPLKTNKERVDWLLERLGKAGCADIEAAITDGHAEKFRRGDATVTLQSVGYEGTLTVADPDLLREALTEGVGHGKAYGLGMLVLR